MNTIQNNYNAQNNLMAISGGVIAGTVGALAGYNFVAPRAAKNIEQLVHLDSDTFYRTIDNMEAARSPVMLEAMSTIVPARGIYNSLEVRINNAFPGDKISKTEFQKYYKNQEKSIKDTQKNIKNILKDLQKAKGTNITLDKYFESLESKKVLTQDLRNILTEAFVSVHGEEALTTEMPVTNKLINIFIDCKNKADSIVTQELNLYKSFRKLEKNGVICKDDMIKLAKEKIKPIVASLTEKCEFGNFKRFIPRKGQAKWAAITGGAAALFTAGCVKLFGDKNL